MISFAQLEQNREQYKDIHWVSGSGSRVLITNMDDGYILNALRSVANKVLIAERYPLVKEFSEYEGISYVVWGNYLYNEYQYRQRKDETDVVVSRTNAYKDALKLLYPSDTSINTIYDN